MRDPSLSGSGWSWTGSHRRPERLVRRSIFVIVTKHKGVLVADGAVDVSARWGRLLEGASGCSCADDAYTTETCQARVVPGKTRVRSDAQRADGAAAAQCSEYMLSGFRGQRGRAGEA
jgi:hypothetical protein